jgi:hypothetical protein
VASETDPALALLSDILLDERDWTVAEVRRLIALREMVALRRGDDAGHCDASGSVG